MNALDQHIQQALEFYARKLEKEFAGDILAYVGPIIPPALPHYVEIVEALKSQSDRAEGQNPDHLVIVLTTPGGVVESVEKMVEVTRHHYSEVSFVVPDIAMSAGTVWCMSGDRIYMDYASSLGPIDPQVEAQNGKSLIPALGYIDKVNELIQRSADGELSDAELVMLRGIDLGEMRRFEQARDLSVSLLKDWLVRYKFKNWTEHRSTRPGSRVTKRQKEKRAEEIATALTDNNRWHSHARMIGVRCLTEDLRLEIDDYSEKKELRETVRVYNGLLMEFLEKQRAPFAIHTARL